MSFRGIINRLLYLALTTWIVGSIIDSFGWGLYFALLPISLYEMVRPRPVKKARNPDLIDHDR